MTTVTGIREGFSTVTPYVPDADAAYARALAAGATSLFPPADQPYGDRCGGVEDAWGHRWYIASPLARRDR